MDNELMGRNEYARHRGCAPNAVTKAEEDGRIAVAVVRDDDGKFVGIRWRQADQLWLLNTDLEQAMRGNGGMLPLGPSAPKAAEAPLVQTPAPAPTDRSRDEELRGELLESKLRQQRADTELRELELAERRGELVSVEEQRRVSARRYRAIRDQMQGIPDRLAWLSREDRLKLLAEIRRVLHELSNDARVEAESDAEERVAA